MLIYTQTHRKRGWFRSKSIFGVGHFFSYIRSISYLMYRIHAIFGSSNSSSNNGNFAEFFSLSSTSYWIVCMYFFGVSSRSSSLRYSWRVLFSFAKPVLIYVFRRTSFALRLIKYVYGIVNDNNFSRFIVNDQWATYLWVHINKREIRPNFIFNTVYLDGRR